MSLLTLMGESWSKNKCPASCPLRNAPPITPGANSTSYYICIFSNSGHMRRLRHLALQSLALVLPAVWHEELQCPFLELMPTKAVASNR